MKRLSWKYVAGLIDGEGCIDLQVQKRENRMYIRPRVRIGMADVAKDLILTLHNNYGGHLETRSNEHNSNWSPATSWQLAGYKASCTFLRNIVNHLILKKEQARFCLWMETNIKGKLLTQECVDAVREELKLQKRDSHRLSEQAQERVLALL